MIEYTTLVRQLLALNLDSAVNRYEAWLRD